MPFEFKLPDLGEGVHEGEVVRWLVKPGDVVQPDQPVAEVMTDKVTAELPAPVGGRIVRLAVEAGQVLKVGEVLVEIEPNGEASPAEPADAQEPSQQPPQVAAAVPTHASEAGPPLAVPAVRRQAKELGVDLSQISGTGPGGRITEDDVRAAAAAGPAPAEALPAAAGAPRRVPLRGMRRVIAEHLLDAQRNTAPYTYVEEIDFTELVKLRERVAPLAAKSGVRMTYLPFVLAALGMALREHPHLNAVADPATGDLLVYGEQHIGVAVHTEEGLIVPVIRNVEQRNLLDLAREIDRVTATARAGKLTREDLQGGTFSVTSLGNTGGVMATPMLNTPQVAVLGIHRIAARAVVRDGTVVSRQTANLSLTMDHRYIDGFIGARFAQTLKGYLEDPAVLLFLLAELRER